MKSLGNERVGKGKDGEWKVWEGDGEYTMGVESVGYGKFVNGK